MHGCRIVNPIPGSGNEFVLEEESLRIGTDQKTYHELGKALESCFSQKLAQECCMLTCSLSATVLLAFP
jgi:hypothetical protein